MRKEKLLFFIVLWIFALSTISSVRAEPAAKTTGKIAIIFATGGLGDKSFNDAAYRGMQASIAKYGSNITVNYVEPGTIPEFATYQDAYAEDGSFDLVICVGFLQKSALIDTIAIYPDQKFVLIDDIIDTPNISSIVFKEHEGSFLVGAMAGMVTETDKLGFLGGLDIYLINKFLAGYQQGAEFVNDDVEISYVYSPDPTNPWGDIAGGKVVGQTFYDAGNDIVYAAAGGTGIGVMQAANDTTGKYAIGVDSDQDYLYPGKVLCSMLKLVETAVSTSIDDIMNETYTDWGRNASLGIKENGVGISNMTYTWAEKQVDFTLNGVTKSRGAHIEDLKTMIINGSINVTDVPEIVTTTTTVAATTTTTTVPATTTTTTTEAPTPGFGVVTTIMILSLVVVYMLKRRK